MVYKKYIKRRRVTYGPYLYENRRVGQKVITTYLGKAEPSKNPESFSNHPFRKFLLFVVIIALLALSVFFLMNMKMPQPYATLDLQQTYGLNEKLAGTAVITIQSGESIPENTKVDVELTKDGQTIAESSKPIGDFISASPEELFKETQTCENVATDTTENVCHDETTDVTNPDTGEVTTETNQVCNDEPVQKTEEKCTTNQESLGFYYNTSGSYSVNLGDLVDYTFSEPGNYVLEISSPDIGLDIQKEFVISAPENGDNTPGGGGGIAGNESTNESIINNTIANETLVNETINNETVINNTIVNQTTENLTIVNETITNETIVNWTISLIKDIPNLRIPRNGSLSVNLSEYFSGAESYEFEGNNLTASFDGNIANLAPEQGFRGAVKAKIVAVNGSESLESNEFNVLVGSAIKIETGRGEIKINELVKWTKNVTLETPENVSIELPKEAENINVTAVDNGQEQQTNSGNTSITGNAVLEGKKGNSILSLFSRFINSITGRAIDETNSSGIDNSTADNSSADVVNSIISSTQVILDENATNYIVQYETPAPTATEEDTANGKQVIISAPSELNYTDVLAYTNISEVYDVGQKGNIKIYWEENNSYVLFDAYDLDGNGKLDYLEWNVPHLSNQTFDIILITKAEHLDENRTFVEDVYSYIKDRDYSYTTIPSGDYLRVTFQQSLTNANDITLYAKSNSSGSIEVYEKDSDEKIADFGTIASDGMYKILLTNLQDSQDTFDLKVIGDAGSGIDFDYVIDPTTYSYCYQETANASNVADGSCGQKYTGKYGVSGSWINVNNSYNGYWADYATPSSGAMLYINYSIPSNATFNGTKWMIRDYTSQINLTLNKTCYLNPVQVKVNLSACFLTGTKIKTINGGKNIEDVKVGDYVLSYDENLKANTYSRVTETFEHSPSETSSYLVINNNLKVTPNHIMFVNNNWTEIGNAKVGDTLKVPNGVSRINSIETINKSAETYNLEVDGTHDYYANGYLAHNKGPIFNYYCFNSTDWLSLILPRSASSAYFYEEGMFWNISTVTPDVILIAPVNNSNVTSAIWSFNATFSDTNGLTNATFYLWNSTKDNINTTTNTISGTGNSMNLSVTLPYSGGFTWNYLVFDSVGNSAWNKTNFTLTYAKIYPVFSNYKDNNGTLINSGMGIFNVTVNNTNGTVWLSVNGTNITAVNVSSFYNLSYQFTTNGTYSYIWYACGNSTEHNLNSSDTKYYFVNYTDAIYPIFSSYWDDNASVVGAGTGHFNVTTANTNGTVWLSVNGTNITATNLTLSSYNVSYSFTTNGTYSYIWYAYGNGTSNNLNFSDARYYSVMQPASATVNYPQNNSVLSRDTNPTLNFTLDVPASDIANVTIYNTTDGDMAPLATFQDIAITSVLTYQWLNLEAHKVYSWMIQIKDLSGNIFQGNYTFTPNDEPRPYNMRAETIGNSSITFFWDVPPNSTWIALKVGNQLTDMRYITNQEHMNWTANIYPNQVYDFFWQVGDSLFATGDMHSFQVRTLSWNPELSSYQHRRLVTIDHSTLPGDLENYGLNITLNENNFQYCTYWWGDYCFAYSPAFQLLNYTNHNDIRFTNYYDTSILPYNVTSWDVPGQGGESITHYPDTQSLTGNILSPGNMWDGNWATFGVPNPSGTMYYNYSIPAGAKDTSMFRLSAGGSEVDWDILLPADCYGGTNLAFKSDLTYDPPLVNTYCQSNSDGSWILVSSHNSRYFYDTQMTWVYSSNANIIVMPLHINDTTQNQVPGIDGQYDTKLWMYYGNPTDVDNGSSLSYSGLVSNSGNYTIGDDVQKPTGTPVISNVTLYNPTSTGISINWTLDQAVDSRVKIADNPYFMNATWATTLTNVSENFTHLYDSTNQTVFLTVHSQDYLSMVNVTCSNSSFNGNYTVNSSTGDFPVQVIFLAENSSEFLDWNVTWLENKSWMRYTKTPYFDITNLDTNKVYYYQLNSYGGVGNVTYSGSFTLGTPPSAPQAAFVNYSADRPDDLVSVCANLTDLNGDASVQANFQYWNNDTDTSFYETVPVTLSSAGTFCQDITNLPYGHVYNYRAKLVGSSIGYSSIFSQEYFAVQEFFAGDPSVSEGVQRDVEYCPPAPDGTVNITERCYSERGYLPGTLRQNNWIYVETNVSTSPLTVSWFNGNSWADYPMGNSPNGFQYLTLNNLGNSSQTFYIKNLTGMVLNYTKPSPTHMNGANRVDEQAYLSFNGTPTAIDYTIMYPNVILYNSTAFEWCQVAPGGDMYTCMSVEFWGGASSLGMPSSMTGTSFDRAQLPRSQVLNGEPWDTALMSSTLNSSRPETASLSDLVQRHCYAFLALWWNEPIVPSNNITNYYVHYWQENQMFSTYLGYAQDVAFTQENLFHWVYSPDSFTSDWVAYPDSIMNSRTTVNTVDSSVFNSSYNQSLTADFKGGLNIDTSNDNIYNLGFYEHATWANWQFGKHQQMFIIFNLPHSLEVCNDTSSATGNDNCTVAANGCDITTDSDSDNLTDCKELFVYHTNPKHNDTDEDGQLDGMEVSQNTDANLYTDYKLAVNFTSPTETSGSLLNRNSIQVNATVTGAFNNLTIYLYNLTDLVNSSNSTISPLYENITNLRDGIYFFNSTVYDLDGHLNYSETRNVTIDTISPTIDFTSPTPDNNTRQNANSFDINFTGSKANFDSGWVTLNNTNYSATCSGANPYVCNKIFSDLLDGVYTYHAFANDTARNQNNTKERVLTMDTVSPVVTINSPLDGSTYSADNYDVNILLNEKGNCVYTLDSGATNKTLSTADNLAFTASESGVSDGDYTLDIYCSDLAGNTNSGSVAFTVNAQSSGENQGGGTSGAGGGGGISPEDLKLVKLAASPNGLSVNLISGHDATREVTVSNTGSKTAIFTLIGVGLSQTTITPSVMTLQPGETKTITITLSGLEKGLIAGEILLKSGGVEIGRISVVANIKTENFLFDSSVSLSSKNRNLLIGGNLTAQINLKEAAVQNEKVDVTANYFVKDLSGNTVLQESETFAVLGGRDYNIELPTGNLPAGNYVLGLEIVYPGAFATSSAQFSVVSERPSMFSATLIVIIIMVALAAGAVIWAVRRKIKLTGKRK